MKIDVKIVRLAGALHGLRELPAGHLILHSDQSLVAVDQPLHGGGVLAFGPHGPGKVIATDVAVDNAWTLLPGSGRVLLAQEGRFQSIDASGGGRDEQVKVTGLPAGTFGAAPDAEGRHVLVVVVHAVNPDFAAYGVAMADLANDRLTAEATIRSNADLELAWDRHDRSWLIGDTDNGVVWRWDGAGPAAKLAAPAVASVHGTSFAASENGVFVTTLFTRATGETALVTGHADRDQVAWTAPVVLPGVPVLVVRRHPTRALWACLTQERAGQRIQLRDATGKTLAEAPVHPPANLTDFLWSTATPDQVWAFGTRTLAAVTLTW